MGVIAPRGTEPATPWRDIAWEIWQGKVPEAVDSTEYRRSYDGSGALRILLKDQSHLSLVLAWRWDDPYVLEQKELVVMPVIGFDWLDDATKTQIVDRFREFIYEVEGFGDDEKPES